MKSLYHQSFSSKSSVRKCLTPIAQQLEHSTCSWEVVGWSPNRGDIWGRSRRCGCLVTWFCYQWSCLVTWFCYQCGCLVTWFCYQCRCLVTWFCYQWSSLVTWFCYQCGCLVTWFCYQCSCLVTWFCYQCSCLVTWFCYQWDCLVTWFCYQWGCLVTWFCYQCSCLVTWFCYQCGCTVTWFCYQLIAKPGNKTTIPQWPVTYAPSLKIMIVSGTAHEQSKRGVVASARWAFCVLTFTIKIEIEVPAKLAPLKPIWGWSSIGPACYFYCRIAGQESQHSWVGLEAYQLGIYSWFSFLSHWVIWKYELLWPCMKL